MPFLANVYALDFAFKDLTKLNATAKPENYRTVETTAAGLKAFATWNMTAALQTGREACGGEGFLAINRFAALKADSDIFTTFEGDNTILMQLVAKNLLTDFKDSFKGKTKADLARFVLGEKVAALAARNPLRTFRKNPAHLQDRAAQLDLLRHREHAMLVAAGNRLRTLTSGPQKTDAYTAFTGMQNELLALAFAHVERVVLERFDAAIAACPNASLQPVLNRMANLFALFHLEKHAAWFLEHAIFTGNKSHAITREVDRLCAEVRREAVALVDSFGIPPQCLAAPIALD